MRYYDIDNIANFLIEKTGEKNEYYIRSAATSALGKFLVTKMRKQIKEYLIA